MFIANRSDKSSFVDQLREARQERETERLRQEAAIKVQCCVRRWMAGLHFTKKIRYEKK